MRSLLLIHSALALAALTGCASGHADPADRLVGVWVTELSEACGAGYLFGADGEYEQRLICSDGDSEVELEIYQGTFTATENTLSLDPIAGSCSEEDAVALSQRRTFHYQVHDDGNTLAFTSDEGIVLYESVEDDGMGSSGVIVFGCYTDNTFIERSVQRF